MADRNLTSAIFELKDNKRTPQKPESGGKPNPQRSSTPAPAIRRRSLDAFYVFAIALLALATFAQIGALIAYR